MTVESMMFYCPEHEMVINARTDGEVNSHGSPGHRQNGCESCDKAVHDAFAFAGMDD